MKKKKRAVPRLSVCRQNPPYFRHGLLNRVDTRRVVIMLSLSSGPDPSLLDLCVYDFHMRIISDLKALSSTIRIRDRSAFRSPVPQPLLILMMRQMRCMLIQYQTREILLSNIYIYIYRGIINTAQQWWKFHFLTLVYPIIKWPSIRWFQFYH